MTRLCARPGCGETATSTLSYDYHGGVVWLDRLTFEAHPATHDLCTRHADRLSAPRGWDLHDRRAAAVERSANSDWSRSESENPAVVEPLWRARAS